MAAFSQLRIRSILFALWQAAPDTANSFWELLNAAHSGKWQRIQTGYQLINTGGAGYNQSFHIPASQDDPSNVTDANLQDTFFLIIEAYQRVQAAGLSEDLNGNPSGNPAFLAALQAQFATIKGYVNNFAYAAV